jgi:hypothetical protein
LATRNRLAEQRAIWESFHDAVAALHSIEANGISVGSHGSHGLADVLHYWWDALLEVAPAETVPRQLWALAWLEANLPVGANSAPALCMGDARLVNGIVKGASVRSPAMQFRTDDIIVTNTYIEYEVNERIACIALNRPEDANAQSFELLDALDAAWRVAAEDPEAQVIVL